MKLTILGASGGCGRELVTQAAARGHEVTAVARASSTLELPAGVTARYGDPRQLAFMREAIHGQDAVLSALGLRMPGIAPWAKPEVPDFLDRSTAAIIAAMQAEGVRRLIAISAGGVGDSRGDIPGMFRAFIASTGLRTVYAALERMEKLYLDSDRDVCLCRPTGLSDDPRTGKAKVVPRVTGRATIPRADVAAWMLDAIEAPSFVHRTPMITVTGAPS